MHLDVEQVERWVDGELDPQAAATLGEHLAGCAACRSQVAEARTEKQALQDLLHHLDHAPRYVDARSVLRRARVRDTFPLRWAAGVALALGLGGAAYAIPGSPFPGWIHAAAVWVAAQGGRSRPAPVRPPAIEPQVAPPSAPPDTNVAGVAVAPGRDLVIAFTTPRGAVRVSWIDGPDVLVRAPSGAATYDARVDRLVVDNTGTPATFEIQIPRSAPHVVIRVGERTLFLKEGNRITPPEQVAPGGASELPLSPSRP